MRIIAVNEGDSAAMTASPACVLTLPVTNLQTQSRALVMRTTGLADQVINLSWGSTPKVMSGVAIVRHNLTSQATWRVQVYSDAAMATQVYDSSPVLVNPPKTLGDLEWGVDPLGASIFNGWALAFGVLWLPAPAVGQSARITLSDPANPAGYMQASRLFIGRVIEPMFGPDYKGLAVSWEENTVQTRTAGGTLRSDPTEPYRKVSIQLSWIQEQDRPKLFDLSRTCGKRNDLFLSVFPGTGGMRERDYALAAKLVGVPKYGAPFYSAYDASFDFEES